MSISRILSQFAEFIGISNNTITVTTNTVVNGTFSANTLNISASIIVPAATTANQAPQVGQVQNNVFNYSANATCTVSGTTYEYVATYNPSITEYIDGMIVSFMSPLDNRGPSTFNAGAGSYPIIGESYEPLQGGELTGTVMVVLQWTAYRSSWVIVGGGYSKQVGTAEYSYQAPQWGQTLGGDSTVTNYASDRPLNTVFTNSTGRPIFVSVEGTASAAGDWVLLSVNSYEFSFVPAGQAGNTIAANMIVPPGCTYEATGSGFTIGYWWEY
jgi:hypothetical protein